VSGDWGIGRGRGMGIGGDGRVRGTGREWWWKSKCAMVFCPCTYDQCILQSNWEKKESDTAVFHFKGAMPGLPSMTVHQLWTFCTFFFIDEVWDMLVAKTNL